MKNEHRRLELFLYIDHWAGVTPLLGVKSQLAFHKYKTIYLQFKLLKQQCQVSIIKGVVQRQLTYLKLLGQ